MQQNTNSLHPRTLAFIREHIKKNEVPVSHPYLDNKGKVTIGVGFLADSKEAFLALPLISGNGPATAEEKARAWDALMAEKRAGTGNFNRTPDRYKGVTSLTMPDTAVAARLDQEIATRSAKAAQVIGADAWDKLTEGQKAAAVDIDYATGDIAKFETFVKAARSGDAEGMARESVFHSGINAQGKVQRNWDRIARNYCGAAGLGGAACDAAVRKHFEGTGETPPPVLAVPPAPPSAPKEPALAGKPGEPPVPPVPEKKPDAGADAAGAAQAAANPAVERMKQALLTPGHPADEAMMTRPEIWTEEDARTVMKARMSLSTSDPAHARYADAERRHFAARYGSGPVKTDETGRMLTPELIGTAPSQPAPPRTIDGQDLGEAVGHVGGHVAGHADTHGFDTAVSGLQAGLNWLGGSGREAALSGDGKVVAGPGAPYSPLKMDGLFGPKTAHATRAATATFGAPRVKEASALGSFAEAARAGALARDPDALSHAVGKTFAPLFGAGSESRVATAFQGALNDMGADHLGAAFTPLKQDGWIGPKTAGAFADVFGAAGPAGFVNGLGRGFGFG